VQKTYSKASMQDLHAEQHQVACMPDAMMRANHQGACIRMLTTTIPKPQNASTQNGVVILSHPALLRYRLCTAAKGPAALAVSLAPCAKLFKHAVSTCTTWHASVNVSLVRQLSLPRNAEQLAAMMMNRIAAETHARMQAGCSSSTHFCNLSSTNTSKEF